MARRKAISPKSFTLNLPLNACRNRSKRKKIKLQTLIELAAFVLVCKSKPYASASAAGSSAGAASSVVASAA